MKVKIPIIGIKDGHPVIDNIFENVCETAGINIGTIIGCPSNNIEDRARPFIVIKDKLTIKKMYEDVPQKILEIYPNRPNRILIHFVEIDIDKDKTSLLTEDDMKLIGIEE